MTVLSIGLSIELVSIDAHKDLVLARCCRLWNIYQNEITYYFTDRNISMYADDHQAYVSGITLLNVQINFKK